MATSDNRTIPWEIEPQTKVKHELLKSYMATWMNILWQQQERMRLPAHLIYVDGFAGPGEYWTDQNKTQKVDGSPIIVGKIANDLIKGHRKLDIVAFDDDKRTIAHLEPLLNKLNTRNQAWEANLVDFSSGIKSLMDKLTTRLGRDLPTFFFIDPFGYSGFPMLLLAEILKRERTEVFITFMAYDIIRFMGKVDAENKMVDLFGTKDYKACADTQTSEERVSCITNLYRHQLINLAKAKHVVAFRINTPNQGQRAKYFLFHASNHVKALKEMKNAMDRTSDREFKFEAIGLGPEEQLDLFEASPEVKMKATIFDFISQAHNGKLEYSVVEDWAYDRTSGIARNIKKAICELEKEGKLKIHRKQRQKTNTVVDGALIEFVPTLL